MPSKHKYDNWCRKQREGRAQKGEHPPAACASPCHQHARPAVDPSPPAEMWSMSKEKQKSNIHANLGFTS